MAIRLASTSVRGTREGSRTIVKSFHVDTEDEIFQAVVDNATYRGFRATGDFDASNWEDDTIEAGFEVNIAYGTIDPEKDGGNDEYGGTVAKWDFDPSFEKEPIEKHPQIEAIVEKYAGEEDPDSGRIIFKRKLPANANRDDRRGFQGSQNTRDDETNPAYGFSESGYIVMSGMATARYITQNTSSALNAVGRVFENLPSNAPDYGIEDDRNWLKAPPQINEIAETEDGERWYEITHSFLLSEKGGWPDVIYEFIDV